MAKKKRLTILVLALATVAFVAIGCSGEDLGDVSGVVGTVLDAQGAPVANLDIVLGEEETTTDENGKFEMIMLPGTHELTLTKDGNTIYSRELDLVRGKNEFTLFTGMNWSFEEGVEPNGAPVHWPSIHGTGQYGTHFTVSDERAYDGDYSFRLNKTSNIQGTGIRSVPVPVPEGATIEASVWVYVEAGGSPARFWIEARSDADFAHAARINQRTPSSTKQGEWEQMKDTWTVPRGTQYITFLLYSNADDEGVVYWDDVDLLVIH